MQLNNKPVVAIVGSPNVGKSTLLNRLAGRRIAIVEDLPGTTRDRVMADVRWGEKGFTLVDTGGLVPPSSAPLSDEVNQQVEDAIAGADVIIFLVDIKSGLTAADWEIAERLRQATVPVVLVVNKADNEKIEQNAAEFYELGLEDPVIISAYHGRGDTELLERLTALLPELPVLESTDNLLKIAIAGRPNVGKSMLLNAMLGRERAIVSTIPGTTRDAIDTLFEFEGESVLLIDTAGIRRRGRQERGVEKYSVLRSLQAISRADVALLVLDATELLTAQDSHVAGYIQQATKGVVVVVNKWDLLEDGNKQECTAFLRSHLRFMDYAPILYTSAKNRAGINRIMPQVKLVYDERMKRLPTAEVNRVIQDAMAEHQPSRQGRRLFKVYYVTQAEVNPPTFVFFVNDVELLHFSYRRFLENRLRAAFGFVGTPH